MAEIVHQAFDAAALISSAPSKVVPCSLPSAAATHANATLSLDTGGDSATCSDDTVRRGRSQKETHKREQSKRQARKRRVAHPVFVKVGTARRQRNVPTQNFHRESRQNSASSSFGSHLMRACSTDWCDRTDELHPSSHISAVSRRIKLIRSWSTKNHRPCQRRQDSTKGYLDEARGNTSDRSDWSG